MVHPENHCHADDDVERENDDDDDDDLVSRYHNEHCSNHKLPHSGSDGSANWVAMMNLKEPMGLTLQWTIHNFSQLLKNRKHQQMIRELHRFSSPFQLDPNNVATSQVRHGCTLEPGLPRPALLRVMELRSGGKHLPKRPSRLPDSIRSVDDQPSSPHGFVTEHDGIQLGDPFATANH